MFYVMYLIWLRALRHPMPAVRIGEVPKTDNIDENHNGSDKAKILLRLCGSFGLVGLASHVSVSMAVQIVKAFELSLETIGSIFFSIGTSLPELVISMHAVRKKEYTMAVGNALGSAAHD